MRDSVVFYKSFRDAIKDLPAEEQLKAYDAIFDYAFDDEEPEEKGVASMVLKFVKPQIDANNERYNNGKKGAEYGKLGGRPKNEKPQENPTETPPKPQDNPTETPNVNVNVNVNDNDLKEKEQKKSGRFAPPSLEEIKAYCLERNNKVDPEGFYDFYQSKGWKVGNSPMKDWKASIRTWEKRDNRGSPGKKNKFSFVSERDTDLSALEEELLGKKVT